ncbi:hypothetical protein [Enhygromyxa salina]|uniref:Uncharacterized protein n=1 Tax=Enhygromyxa salina TaxID=215803 RepID=A0A2S9YJF0_9BACT|nr:hypothetical protein [Enhygromyxa salina]PRQ05238.1 hypothetical protein ENSA7_46880 [Enhygromyxa salina]
MDSDLFIFITGFVILTPVVSSVGILIWFGSRARPPDGPGPDHSS